MKKILTGIKATGAGMHLGNYLWMFQPLMNSLEWKKAFLFIPDFHSLTSVHNAEVLKSNKERLIREIFALLPENSDITIFEQSKIRGINDITWILSSVTSYSLMLRAHTFKDTQNKNSDINMATFNYPILMAADILSYDIDLVPVGKDQKQHLEFARDIASNFNKTYDTEFFKLPEPIISEEVGLIPWIDGRKMSKSYDNHIGVFDTEKVMKKKIMAIETDSKWLDDPKDPETCNIYALMRFFASAEQLDEIAHKYKAGWYGYGHAKLELLAIVLEYFKMQRERYFSEDTAFAKSIEKKLEQWNAEAQEILDEKYTKLKEIIGL